MYYKVVSMGKGARIEKRDEEAHQGFREIAKIMPSDHKRETREVINELRQILDDAERAKEIRELVEEEKELMKALE